jgi:hypothetical protein
VSLAGAKSFQNQTLKPASNSSLPGIPTTKKKNAHSVRKVRQHEFHPEAFEHAGEYRDRAGGIERKERVLQK